MTCFEAAEANVVVSNGEEPTNPDVAFPATDTENDDVVPTASQQNGGPHEFVDFDFPRHDETVCRGPPPRTADNCCNDISTEIEHASIDNREPLFLVSSCYRAVDDVMLFQSPCLPAGNCIDVYMSCATGKCSCSYYLDGVLCQLRPCRFAYLMYGGFVDGNSHKLVFHGICEGFRIVDENVDPYVCDNYDSILSDSSKPLMDTIVQKELLEGYISVSKEKPDCIHSLGAVPKGTDSIRPITDCSRPTGEAVNNHCSSLTQKFTYNGIHDVVALLQPNDYMSVIDIQSAYRAVPIHPSHRKYLGFQWEFEGEPTYFTDNRLCFGLSTGPFYFHSISKFIADVLQFLGVNVVHYLDDYIVISNSYQGALQSQLWTIKVLRYLGFYVSWRKITPPSTVTTYLGIVVDSTQMQLRLPVEKVDKFKCYVKKYYDASTISKKELEQLNGLLAHCAQVIQGGRIFTRRCFNAYRDLVQAHRRSIRVSPGMREDLGWWLEFAPGFNGVALIPYVQHHTDIYTDSSLRGFGAVYGSQWLAGCWDGSMGSDFCSTTCNHWVEPPEVEVCHQSNINVLELWAVVAAVERWAPNLANSSVDLYTDNLQVLYMIRGGASINTLCMRWLRRLFWACMKNNIKVSPVYVASESNVAADTLSRLPHCVDPTEIQDKLSPFKLCCYLDLCIAVTCRNIESYEEGVRTPPVISGPGN